MKNESQSLLLRGARVVLPDRVLNEGAVLIEGGRIGRVIEGDGSGELDAEETRDIGGATLMPGFIDIHIHGAVGVDMMSASAGDMHSVALYLAARGTTAWLPTTVPAPDENYLRFARETSELMRTQDERPPAARALGAHYEGPFVNRAQCGALRTAYFREWADVRSLDFLPEISAQGAVHLMTLAPETAGGC